jgi:hypothetical protein
MSSKKTFENINKRSGTGNREITRPGFMSTAPKERQLFSDIAEPVDTIDALAATLTVKIPDTRDTEWVAEKNRMTGVLAARGLTPDEIEFELQVNKPLGRDQRTITTNVNAATAGVDNSSRMSAKLDAINKQVSDGRVESRARATAVLAQIGLVLADTAAISSLSSPELISLSATLTRLAGDTSYTAMGIHHRYIGKEYYEKHEGLINLLFMINANERVIPGATKEQILDRPVLNFKPDAKGVIATGGVPGGIDKNGDFIAGLKLHSMKGALSGKKIEVRNFLDLGRLGIINGDQLRSAVLNTPNGFNNPLFGIGDEYIKFSNALIPTPPGPPGP